MIKSWKSLSFDIANIAYIEGEKQNIFNKTSRDYSTVLCFNLPYDMLVQGEYTFEYHNFQIIIRFSKFLSKKEDKIFEYLNKIKDRINFNFNGDFLFSILPLENCMDNNAHYPCTYVEIILPYRQAEWADLNHPSGMKYEKEEAELYEVPFLKDKIHLLTIFNYAIERIDDLKTIKKLRYTDLISYIEVYFDKSGQYVLLSCLNLFTYKEAFKDLFYKYYFGTGYESIISEFRKVDIPINEIQNETQLLHLIKSIIESKLVHYIENRRWIEPFWDGHRLFQYNGTKIKIPQSPKTETQISPTLHVIFSESLTPFGVIVTREADEGIGKIDFKFSYTTKEGVPLDVISEFKLAHHKKIENGLKKQLPAYLKANNSTSGFFIIMWFKDNDCKFFAQPEKYTKEEMITFIQKRALEINKLLNLNIMTLMIDASIRPSASKE